MAVTGDRYKREASEDNPSSPRKGPYSGRYHIDHGSGFLQTANRLRNAMDNMSLERTYHIPIALDAWEIRRDEQRVDTGEPIEMMSGGCVGAGEVLRACRAARSDRNWTEAEPYTNQLSSLHEVSIQ